MRMRTSALLLGMLVLAGCKSEANRKLDAITDRACACKDAACADKVQEDLKAFAKEHEGKPGDNEAAKKSIVRALGCLAQARAEDPGEEVMEGARERAMRRERKEQEAEEKEGGEGEK